MKNVLGILISLVLVLGQPFGNRLVAAGATPNCGCKMMQCCMSDSKAPSQEAPAVPNSSQFQKELQGTVAPVLLALTLPQISDAPAASVSPSPLVAGTVPIFTRDCAFLI